MWGDQHLCDCIDTAHVKIPRLSKRSSSANKITMISGDEDIRCYMEGDYLTELIISNNHRRRTKLINWTSITHFDEKTLLYTIENSASVYLVNLSQLPTGRNTTYGSGKHIHKNTPVLTLSDSIPHTVSAPKDGYIAVLAQHKDHKQLSLYADQEKTGENFEN